MVEHVVDRFDLGVDTYDGRQPTFAGSIAANQIGRLSNERSLIS
jgi:hypothetical protein